MVELPPFHSAARQGNAEDLGQLLKIHPGIFHLMLFLVMNCFAKINTLDQPDGFQNDDLVGLDKK